MRGRCQKITGVGHFIESTPTRCWLTREQHRERAMRELRAAEALLTDVEGAGYVLPPQRLRAAEEHLAILRARVEEESSDG
ncbi:hypothetical protein B1R94_02265 [Mycolicibacterium litorale]|nr:hypothetical protein B1R94_02265 [Mycolicibacterium litorale]